MRRGGRVVADLSCVGWAQIDPDLYKAIPGTKPPIQYYDLMGSGGTIGGAQKGQRVAVHFDVKVRRQCGLAGLRARAFHHLPCEPTRTTVSPTRCFADHRHRAAGGDPGSGRDSPSPRAGKALG